MRNIAIIVAGSLLFLSHSVFATQARVNALGGVNAIILDDDANIDIFPQQIEKYDLMRISNAQAADAVDQSGFAAIMGESGNKWGVYGGHNEDNLTAAHHNREILSIYHSVNANAAYKAGVTASSYDVEPASGNQVYNMGVDLLYGMKSGNTESAIKFNYDKDPYSLSGCTAADLGIDNPPAGFAFANLNGSCGSNNAVDPTAYRSYHGLMVGYASRSPRKIAMFSHMYWDVNFSHISANYNTSSAANDDESIKGNALMANVWLFSNKTFHKKDKFYYAIGMGLLNRSMTYDQEPTASTKYSERTIVGPNLALGLEKPIKYGVLRFGVHRDFNLYDSSQIKTTAAETNINSRGYPNTGATGKSLYISTGWGLDYDNLKIDLVLNSAFWSHGPQMVFDSSDGAIAARADIVYNFK